MREEGQSRVIQGVMMGIGFLASGVILKHREGDQVTGLTTAAGLWLTAAVGLTAGAGLFGLALLGAGLTWVVLDILQRFEPFRPPPSGGGRSVTV
jgi:putative Mg2+ transporter-C (MgtC) family protein